MELLWGGHKRNYAFRLNGGESMNVTWPFQKTKQNKKQPHDMVPIV